MRSHSAKAHVVLQFGHGMTYDLGAQLLELSIVAEAEINHIGLLWIQEPICGCERMWVWLW